MSGKVVGENGVEQCFVQPIPDEGMEAEKFQNFNKTDKFKVSYDMKL